MKKKHNLKRIVIVLASVYIGYILVSTQLDMIKIKKDIKTKQQELGKLKEKNQKLQDEFEIMTKNPEAYAEKLARERLGLIKEGETPVIDKK